MALKQQAPHEVKLRQRNGGPQSKMTRSPRSRPISQVLMGCLHKENLQFPETNLNIYPSPKISLPNKANFAPPSVVSSCTSGGDILDPEWQFVKNYPPDYKIEPVVDKNEKVAETSASSSHKFASAGFDVMKRRSKSLMNMFIGRKSLSSTSASPNKRFLGGAFINSTNGNSTKFYGDRHYLPTNPEILGAENDSVDKEIANANDLNVIDKRLNFSKDNSTLSSYNSQTTSSSSSGNSKVDNHICSTYNNAYQKDAESSINVEQYFCRKMTLEDINNKLNIACAEAAAQSNGKLLNIPFMDESPRQRKRAQHNLYDFSSGGSSSPKQVSLETSNHLYNKSSGNNSYSSSSGSKSTLSSDYSSPRSHSSPIATINNNITSVSPINYHTPEKLIQRNAIHKESPACTSTMKKELDSINEKRSEDSFPLNESIIDSFRPRSKSCSRSRYDHSPRRSTCEFDASTFVRSLIEQNSTTAEKGNYSNEEKQSSNSKKISLPNLMSKIQITSNSNGVKQNIYSQNFMPHLPPMIPKNNSRIKPVPPIRKDSLLNMSDPMVEEILASPYGRIRRRTEKKSLRPKSCGDILNGANIIHVHSQNPELAIFEEQERMNQVCGNSQRSKNSSKVNRSATVYYSNQHYDSVSSSCSSNNSAGSHLQNSEMERRLSPQRIEQKSPSSQNYLPLSTSKSSSAVFPAALAQSKSSSNITSSKPSSDNRIYSNRQRSFSVFTRHTSKLSSDSQEVTYRSDKKMSPVESFPQLSRNTNSQQHKLYIKNKESYKGTPFPRMKVNLSQLRDPEIPSSSSQKLNYANGTPSTQIRRLFRSPNRKTSQSSQFVAPHAANNISSRQCRRIKENEYSRRPLSSSGGDSESKEDKTSFRLIR